MSSAAVHLQPSLLAKDRSRALELLFRAMVLPPSTSIVLRSDDGFSADATHGGILRLTGAEEDSLEVVYRIQPLASPGRHLLVWKAKPKSLPSDLQGSTFSLLDADGHIVTWSASAESNYGYSMGEVAGRDISMLLPTRGKGDISGRKKLRVGPDEGSIRNDCQLRKDGSRFQATVITLPIRAKQGNLLGFARIVNCSKGQRQPDAGWTRSFESADPGKFISAVAFGELDRITDANETFLNLVGYDQLDLSAGLLTWSLLTPSEYQNLDIQANEEALRSGASVPFEKKLIHKDGTRVPVMVNTAILRDVPFRWVAVLADLRLHDEQPVAAPDVIIEEIIGTSAAIKRASSLVGLVAPTSATVLILGETGTGKELIARAIHKMSSRSQRPFVTLNCAAIPTGLLESELFGYERGAFTGALAQKIGRFELAEGGTLFLDEVGDIPMHLQPKLLRALQDKSFERLGGTRSIAVDVRLVAATNRNLTQMMNEGLFRRDLFYRLNVFPITPPPLRDRPEDIPLLARFFIKKYAAKTNRRIIDPCGETLAALRDWPWPGNVRELESFIERSVILSRGFNLNAPLHELRLGPAVVKENSLDQARRDHILSTVRETGGVISTAARLLGTRRTTLVAKMKKLGISRRGYEATIAEYAVASRP